MYPNSIYFGLQVVPIWVLWGQSISIWLHGPLGQLSCRLRRASSASVFSGVFIPIHYRKIPRRVIIGRLSIYEEA